MAEFIKKVVEKLFNKETVTYIIFGVLTTIVSILVYNACIDYGMSTAKSNTISTVIAVSFAFITNKIWVFESRDFGVKTIALEFLKFGAGRVVTFLIETGLLIFMVDMMMLNAKGCKYFTQVIIIVLNYVISKFAVFKRS